MPFAVNCPRCGKRGETIWHPMGDGIRIASTGWYWCRKCKHRFTPPTPPAFLKRQKETYP